MSTLFINGKFTAQRVTGVQRLAAGLIVAMDRQLSRSGSQDHWVLLCPPGAKPPVLKHIEVRFAGPSRGSLHLWEQIFLPLYTAGRTLFNLAGPAPLCKFNQVCMVPDAAVFDYPDAYTPAFGAWYRFLFRVIIRSARLTLTISEFSRQQLINAVGAPAARVKIVYCAADHIAAITPDPAIVDRLGLAEVPYLLAVGSLNPTKNLPTLVAAFGAVAEENVRLVLVGANNAGVFSKESLQGKNDTRIISTGAINDAELSALYVHACAFVFPSIYEGFGIPPLEAMLLQCPVAASNAASIPEVCGDGALYFDPRSPVAMRSVLERMLAEPATRELLRVRGAQVAQKFSWERSAAQLLNHVVDAGLVRREQG